MLKLREVLDRCGRHSLRKKQGRFRFHLREFRFHDLLHPDPEVGQLARSPLQARLRLWVLDRSRLSDEVML